MTVRAKNSNIFNFAGDNEPVNNSTVINSLLFRIWALARYTAQTRQNLAVSSTHMVGELNTFLIMTSNVTITPIPNSIQAEKKAANCVILSITRITTSPTKKDPGYQNPDLFFQNLIVVVLQPQPAYQDPLLFLQIF